MKKILNLFLSILTLSSFTISVVACGEEDKSTNKNIINGLTFFSNNKIEDLTNLIDETKIKNKTVMKSTETILGSGMFGESDWFDQKLALKLFNETINLKNDTYKKTGYSLSIEAFIGESKIKLYLNEMSFEKFPSTNDPIGVFTNTILTYQEFDL